jgi:lipid A ethanolaminephosphotransferase
MRLKLFHESEFAQSRLTPERQRNSLHPALLAVIVALWVAGAGNLALWRELLALPGLDTGEKLWLGLDVLAVLTAACGALLGLLCWRWTFKLVASALLLASAWGAGVMLLSDAPVNSTLLARALANPWQTMVSNGLLPSLALLLVLALLPAILLWRQPVRRLSLGRNAKHNLVLLLGCGAVFTFAALLFHQMPEHQQMRELFNPMSLVHGVLEH